MWYTIAVLTYPRRSLGSKLTFIKTAKKMNRIPAWTYALLRPHKTYEIVPASNFIPRLKNETKTFLRTYQHVWLNEGEFRRVIEKALNINYKDPAKVGYALARLNEWMDRPIIQRKKPVRSHPYVIRKIPYFIKDRARGRIYIAFGIAIYIFSETFHVCNEHRCVVFSQHENTNHDTCHHDLVVNGFIDDVASKLERLADRPTYRDDVVSMIRVLKEFLGMCSLMS